MMKLIKTALFLGMTIVTAATAADDFPNIDRTDKVSERRYLDSLNVYNRRPIRVNQSGFRPQDHKYAYVADPSVKTFKVIDANTGKQVDAGNTNLTLLDANAPKPNIWVNGSFNSLDVLYEFGKNDSLTTATEALYKADFTGLTTMGEYYIVVGNDTSATFYVHPSIFNAILENSLKFFGIQRCGNTKSHMHAACHLKDGSAIGHDLTGGWHDCGDHFKPSETIGYTAYALATTYLVYKDKAEDRYGNSYADTTITDGIPDILYEAKVGADYIFKLYKASKADGLIAKNDMYHTVGSELDHQFWDVPEKQDAQAYTKGGPDRDVTAEVGTYSGAFAAALAYFAAGWEPYDPVYADSLLEAARDIYTNVTFPHTTAGQYGLTKSTIPSDLYPGGSNPSNMNDDAAAAALALWYATKDTIYQYDLYKNTKIHDNPDNYRFNNEPNDAGPYFRGGYLGQISGFYPGGWMTDYENVHAYVLFSFVKLILENKEVALSYNVGELERDTLLQRATNSLRRLTDDGSQGSNKIYENRFGSVKAVPPYNLVWTSSDWGFNRYNMGAANAIFMLSEITTGAEHEAYLNLALDNIYYNLGANPWDISFIMGAGDKNQNHPHNRTANPDGYNAGGMPYEYRCPRGALMGGAAPTRTLLEDWKDYTATETCIDFSVQLLMPAQSLAATLPIDAEGPLFSNIAGTPITETSAIVSWDANEVALVTVFYNTTPSASGAKSVQQTTASKGGAVTLEGLVMGETYYFFLEGMDTKRNISTDDNHGQWYQFTMTPSTTTISGVTICQVDNRSAKIFWWSGDRMNGIVNYGTSMTALNEAQAAEGGAVLFHQATLTNLKPGTTYYFNVSSGATTDDNGGKGYSFTTDAYSTYANLDISIKPSSYQDNAVCSDWKDCKQFIINITNNDTIPFEDFELRLYLNNPNLSALCNIKQNFGGSGLAGPPISIDFGSAQPDGFGGYYLPIKANGVLEVSGRLVFQVLLHDYNPNNKTTNFGELVGSWSLRAHTSEDDPVQFNGIDLTKGPYYTGSETTFLETVNGVKEVAFTRDPYVTVYYHGRHIYGYGPDYTPENGPQVHRVVNLAFESPFVSPVSSVEKEEYQTSYIATSAVSPTGMLDDFEMNGNSRMGNTMYLSSNRKDSLLFRMDTTLGYSNNYMEFVSWHNHAANLNGSYDCACAVVRSNVEIDTITVPPEQRYLVFTVDTVRAYILGSPTEVHVKLLDSAHTPITNERITIILGSEAGLAKFYASAEATISTAEDFKVDVVNGEAVFYVKADQVLETNLTVLGPNTSKVVYASSTTHLSVADLPPWPLIETAVMVDTDCDNKPDAMNIVLFNDYTEGQTFKSIKYVYNNDTLIATNVISKDGLNMVIALDIQDTSVNTNPSGYVALVTNDKGTIRTESTFYKDGIAPTLLSVSVLERLDTATTDHVYFQFSEPIADPGIEWPVQLFAGDQITAGATPVIIDAKEYNPALNIWEYEIAFDAGGGSLVKEGMFAQLLSTSTIQDKNGNGIAALCGQPKLPITLKLIPIPMIYAFISDNDEDGLAEHVEVEFARPMDTRHIPDSISIDFGLSEEESIRIPGTDAIIAPDGMTAVINLKTPFALGNTSGKHSGTVKGIEIEGAGLVTEHLGSGASYTTSSTLAEDMVGPVITSAVMSNNNSSNLQFLLISLSEPCNNRDASLVLYRQKQDGHDTTIFESDLATANTPSRSSIMTVGYDKESPLSVNDGDYVRLQPKEMSAIIDMKGNLPSLNSPWVPISGVGKPRIKFNVKMAQHLVSSGNTQLSAQMGDKNIRYYVMNPTTKKLDLIVGGKAVPTVLDSAALSGAIWKIELNVPRGAPSSEEAAWDTLKVHYNIPIYTNLGSYVNRLAGTFKVLPNQHFSSAGKVIFFAEWANMPETGIQTESGRAAGTGAYVYKAEFDCKFIPNKNKDAATIKRFETTNSYEKTETFGIKRIK